MGKTVILLTWSFYLFTQTNCIGQQTNRIKNENQIRQTIMDSGKIVAKTADELITEFSINSELATEKYRGKTLQITGEIVERSSPKDHIPDTNASYIVFGNGENGSVHIQCYFDEVVSFDLRKGETITVTGHFEKFQNIKDIMKTIVLEKSHITTQ